MNILNSEETIFAEALRLPPEQRAAYLAQATRGNAELRRRVESLLGSYEAGDFLEQAAAPQSRQTLRIAVPLTEKPGDRIGRYKLLEQIGEGGCGVVYVAEQVEPVRRRVALKIIKLGMDTKSVIARFEAERQALALMDHPNIAKVFDAGSTERPLTRPSDTLSPTGGEGRGEGEPGHPRPSDGRGAGGEGLPAGRPYFVMELVRGLKITDYCDEAKLSTNARLDLFIQVCQAIQHAHQKGIIHRDIKPSNILVTVNDGVAVPKVIDFGIAKATSGQQLTDKTIYTAFEQFIGTPAYMSPEQAVLTSLDIDTRSDVYALGVLLYEMLTGKTPFDAKELLAIGLDEMRRTIRETEPLKPSTRVSTLPGDQAEPAAQRRSLDAPKLASELRGDLDWIVMKALEKDRTRRYETANGLAMDIQRHLNNEPVVACPPSATYRFQKMVRRNKLIFTAATVVFAALVTGLGISTWLFLREREARTRAVAAEQAERNLRQKAELHPLAEYHARHGYWTKAGAEFAQLIEQKPSDGATIADSPDDWHKLAAILAYKGEIALYREHCRRTIERFGNSLDPVVAHRIAKDCLILPDSGVDLGIVDRLASISVSKEKRKWGPPSSLKALAEYRQRRFASAADWAEKTLAHPEVASWVTIQTSATLAMARHHLNEDALARAALKQAQDDAHERLPMLDSGYVGGEWLNVLISHALLREAKVLIEGNPETRAETK